MTDLRLTETQRVILRGILRGESLQQIADRLTTTRKSITVLCSRLYRRIGAANRFHVRERLEELGTLATIEAEP